MKTDGAVTRAYRSTFGDYACKLEALQRLLEADGPDNGRLEAAMRDVETARRAHNAARDLLALELGVNDTCDAQTAVR